MKDRILIEKELIPYIFDISLDSELYQIEVNYNENADLFTLSLIKSDEVLVYNEPIIYGVPLFQDIFNVESFPAITIIALDEASIEDKVTYNNFNETVFLCVENE